MVGGRNISACELTADGSWLTVRQIPGIALAWNRIVFLRIARGIFGHIALSSTVPSRDSVAAIKLDYERA